MITRRPWGLWLLSIWLTLGSRAAGAPFHPDEITAILFLPDRQTLLFAGKDDLHIWDLAQGKERLRIAAHTNGIYGLALSPDGKRFASAGGDHLVRLWDVRTLKELRAFEGHRKEVVALAFSPDGQMLASGGYDGTVRLWSVASGKELHVLRGHPHRVTTLPFSPDGKLLASGGIVPFETENFKGSTEADFVRLWDPHSGKELKRLPVKGQQVAFTPDGKYLIAAGMYIELVRPQKGVIFAPGMFDGGSRTVVWDLKADAERLRLNEYYAGLALSADGKYFATYWGSRLHGGGMVLTNWSRNRGLHVRSPYPVRNLRLKAATLRDSLVIPHPFQLRPLGSRARNKLRLAEPAAAVAEFAGRGGLIGMFRLAALTGAAMRSGRGQLPGEHGQLRRLINRLAVLGPLSFPFEFTGDSEMKRALTTQSAPFAWQGQPRSSSE